MSLLNDALRKEKDGQRAVNSAPGQGLQSKGRSRIPKRLSWKIAGLLCMATLMGGTGLWYWWTQVEAAPRPDQQAVSLSVVTTDPNLEPPESPPPESEITPGTNLDSQPQKHPTQSNVVASAVAPAAEPEKRPEVQSKPKSEPSKPSPSPKKPEQPATKKKTATTKKAAKKPHTKPIAAAKDASKQAEPKTAGHQKSIDRLYQKAKLYHRHNRLDHAIGMYREVLKLDPEHYDGLFNLSSVYIQINAFDKAHAIASNLHYRAPDDHLVTTNLAIAEIGLGRPERALRLLDQSGTGKDVPLFKIYFHKGVANRQLGQVEEAIRWYKKAEQLQPSDPALLFNIAVAYDQQQQYKEAVAYYRKYLQESKPDGQGAGLPPARIEGRIRALMAGMAAEQ